MPPRANGAARQRDPGLNELPRTFVQVRGRGWSHILRGPIIYTTIWWDNYCSIDCEINQNFNCKINCKTGTASNGSDGSIG